MATIALSVVGMALGGAVGGSVMGLSMATIGRAAGAAIGRRIDQQVMGGGSEAIEGARIDRFRLTGATEGADIQQVYGRMRIAGQAIWASQFKEQSTTTQGNRSTPTVTTYQYSVSLALALCEGEVSRIGRIWADGTEVPPDSLNLRLYAGRMDQQPDPKIAAVEGLENTPAYRGTAYVVIEDMALEQFDNRIPQLTFEVMRPARSTQDAFMQRITGAVLTPRAGEYGLATSQVHVSNGFAAQQAVNTNSPFGGSDFSVSMDALQGELPQCQSIIVPIAWFGDDLRCADCTIAPQVEAGNGDATAMPWRVSGITRAQADQLPQVDGASIYGGTPADASLIEAIKDLRARGLKPVMQPLLLMTQQAGNALPNPLSTRLGQPVQPWCGLITTSLAPAISSAIDGTPAADTEIAAFFGTATPAHISVSGGVVGYSGHASGGYRRFVLHYAKLCAAAGGVDAFCVGTDLKGLTCVRGANGAFPAVIALKALAADVRAILGANCQISYAADNEEYRGYTPAGTQDRYFPLDGLWADANIDFVGANARMPLSDWRAGENHSDAGAGSIYDLDYLTGNVAGGECYDWVYETPEARAAQLRTPITDDEGEPWVWRAKDIAGWWSNAHYPRIDGQRALTPTAWVPRSKPVWFMQLGCAAVDKGANQIDPATQTPFHSNGARDDLMQLQYLRAVSDFYADGQNNPASDQFAGRMLDTGRMHANGWDPRPYPYWPGNQAMWSDGGDYATGAWLNGRATNCSLASVVAEICDRSGVTHYDVTGLFGIVRGYIVSDSGTGRAALQPLMLAYGFDAIERDGVLVFRNRRAVADYVLTPDSLALDPERDQALSLTRASAAEIAGRVQLGFVNAEGHYDAIASEAIMPDETTISVTRNELPLALTRKEGARIVARWLQEARVGRDTAEFALPPSQAQIGAGDVVALETADATSLYRIDRIEEAGLRLAQATRVDAEVDRVQRGGEQAAAMTPFVGPIPAELLFLDLPLLTGDEIPHAPYVAATGRPWPGRIAVYGAPQDSDYALLETLGEAAIIGVTQTTLRAGPIGIWDRQTALAVTLVSGAFSSATPEALLAGANTIAIGSGAVDDWEIMQFQKAVPLSAGRFALSGLLRGQSGSWGTMPQSRSAGANVVMLNAVPTQINLPSASRGTARHFRFGPASQPITDPSYRYESYVFAGIGLRPYPVAHLRAVRTQGGAAVNWIRCTRIDGDIWADGEVPLGEDTEGYILRIAQNGTLKREVTLSSPTWAYSAANLAADVGSGAFDVSVAQVSARFGAGPFSKISVVE
ncbi:glycoside hydrolase/phage tail family protein [Yoonia sp.]|uniref:baseplate multidomain protein megatron n=1 Tax=Yoonia sp. TaxID=2212373 RepID=UPI0025FD9DA0|nr:glycoside hydrolase/phage tail family protein [Yoonia sp.]